ncbi:hypothetical protein scyTo_0002469 [Scyliorhinus torazame]|uniref:Uncharacterized protein n=1 Tax=Scyliorhinus torazame TaxID=75743 RepID=A0A401PJJ8_SCYTO|nr:hypothetical protein [Scyliorhinus torazame]
MLSFGNTFFKHKDEHRDGNTLNEIDETADGRHPDKMSGLVKVLVQDDHFLVLAKSYLKLKSEVQKGTESLKNNKIPGIEKIAVGLLKLGKNIITTELTDQFNNIWNAEDIRMTRGEE